MSIEMAPQLAAANKLANGLSELLDLCFELGPRGQSIARSIMIAYGSVNAERAVINERIMRATKEA